MTDKRVGRPQVAGISDALLQAAERVMASDGFSALTVDALVTEVGTTRPTFYRRFPNVAQLAFEVIRSRFGIGDLVDTGSLHGDLLKLQRQDVSMFSSPLLRNNLPGLLEAVRTDDEIRKLYGEGFVQPRRANVSRVIDAAVARGEISSANIDVEFVCDLLTGPILSRALLPVSVRIGDEIARLTVEVAHRYITEHAMTSS